MKQTCLFSTTPTLTQPPGYVFPVDELERPEISHWLWCPLTSAAQCINDTHRSQNLPVIDGFDFIFDRYNLLFGDNKTTGLVLWRQDDSTVKKGQKPASFENKNNLFIPLHWVDNIRKAVKKGIVDVSIEHPENIMGKKPTGEKFWIIFEEAKARFIPIQKKAGH